MWISPLAISQQTCRKRGSQPEAATITLIVEGRERAVLGQKRDQAHLSPVQQLVRDRSSQDRM
jgi:hypothetical protein